MQLPGDPGIQVGDLVSYRFWREDEWHTAESVYLVLSVGGDLAEVAASNSKRSLLPTALLTRLAAAHEAPCSS